MRMIDGDALGRVLNDFWLSVYPRDQDDTECRRDRAVACGAIEACIGYVQDAPTVGGCKDCKYWQDNNGDKLQSLGGNEMGKDRFIRVATTEEIAQRLLGCAACATTDEGKRLFEAAAWRLKELFEDHEPVEAIYKCDMKFCGNCKLALSKTWQYCPGCGRKVKRDD